MFAAYAGTSKKNDEEQEKKRKEDLANRTRAAMQTAAFRAIDQAAMRKQHEEERAVIRQCGYGESSSDDDCGGVKVMIDKSKRQNEDEVFMLPEKRKQKEAKRLAAEARERLTAQNPYHSFPSGPQQVQSWPPTASSSESRTRSGYEDVKQEDSSDDEYSSAQGRKRRNDRSRDSSNRRHRSRESSRKKKKSRKRSSSSSSTGRSSRRRSPSPKRRSVAQKMKYSFLTDEEYRSRDNLVTQILFRAATAEYENYSLGMSSKEIAKCYIGVRFIDGLENNKVIFETLYGKERTSRNESYKFHEELAKVAQHVPREKIFRSHDKNGFWRIPNQMDLLNILDDNGEHSHVDDATLQKRDRLRKAFKENRYDIGSLISWLEVEDEISRSNSGFFSRSDPRAHLERKLSIVEEAIKFNPRTVIVHLMEIEILIQLDASTYDIISKYEKLIHSFPHEPMAWSRYLDYIQYDTNAYSNSKMKGLFTKCLEKVKAIVTGTFVSHPVADMPLFHQFQFSVYMRYLKWLIACGDARLALANIQATFEANYGSPHCKNDKERSINLLAMWPKGFPRIGDENAVGCEKQMKLYETMSEDVLNVQEMAEYDIYLYKLTKAKNEIFVTAAHIGEAWVQFERTARELETRVKRTKMQESHVYTEEYGEELMTLILSDQTEFEEVDLFYCQPDFTVDIVQPLLELLGIVFRSSTGCFTLTEQVIEDWRGKNSILDEEVQFDQVPTYSENTMLAVGERTLQYLLYQRHEFVKDVKDRLDGRLVKYCLAMLMTKAKFIEKQIKPFGLMKRMLTELLDETLLTPHAELVNHYPTLNSVVTLVACDKFIYWLEKEIRQMAEIEQNDKKSRRVGLAITDMQKKKVRKLGEKVFNSIDSCVERFMNEDTRYFQNANTSYPTLQLHLYANILRTRCTYGYTAEKIQRMMAIEILEVTLDHVVEMQQQDNFGSVVKRRMQEIVEKMTAKDSEFVSDYIPEIPRASLLAIVLQIIVDFVFLDTTSQKNKSLETGQKRVEVMCTRYENDRADYNRSKEEKERDTLDIQFLLDTYVQQLAARGMLLTQGVFYKFIVEKAVELFPAEPKYMKLFTEVNGGSGYKSIKLDQVLKTKNQVLLKKRLERFDPTLERQLLLNCLSSMMSTLTLSHGRGESGERAVFRRYTQEALNLRDPAVWRLVMKVAARIDKKTLEQDAYVRAQGNCVWALNMHIDFVEGMGPAPPGADSPVSKTLLHLLHTNREPKHVIDDDAVLETLWDIGQQRKLDHQQLFIDAK